MNFYRIHRLKPCTWRQAALSSGDRLTYLSSPLDMYGLFKQLEVIKWACKTERSRAVFAKDPSIDTNCMEGLLKCWLAQIRTAKPPPHFTR